MFFQSELAGGAGLPSSVLGLLWPDWGIFAQYAIFNLEQFL
jgi:hypothetical protein